MPRSTMAIFDGIDGRGGAGQRGKTPDAAADERRRGDEQSGAFSGLLHTRTYSFYGRTGQRVSEPAYVDSANRQLTVEPEKTFRILPGGVRTLGRATGADFIVDAALVSRVHCRLDRRCPAASSRSATSRAPTARS